MQKFNINYEYSNNKKNISVKINDVFEIKESQLKMILNNEISYLLPVKFMQTDKMGSLYYNAGNMYAVSEMFGKRKMNISNFVGFLKSFLYMLDEIEGYLLSSKGILLDYKYIFYDEMADDYKYILIPMEYEDLLDREILFFFGDVLKNYYENIYDDFAKEIIDVIRNDGKINDISRIINKYDSKSILGKIINNMENQADNPQFEEDIALSNKKSSPFGTSPQKPNVGNKSKADKVTENKEKKSSVKIVAFIAVQVLGAAIIAKIGMSGIEISKIAALVILLLVVDVIAAKELFFKNNAGKKVKEKKPKQKKAKEIKKEVPVKIENKTLPKNVFEFPPQDRNISKPPIQNNNIFEFPICDKEERFSARAAVQEKTAEPVEIKRTVPNNNELLSSLEDDDDSSETVLMAFPANDIETEETVLMQPLGYIEVYDKEDNITDKYIITKDKTVIGRMKAQADLQIKNLMVGKVHAEVIFESNKLYIKDIHSLNGVYIGENKKRIEKDTPVIINSGEVVYLADVKIKVYSS